jgi:hypothetical protein
MLDSVDGTSTYLRYVTWTRMLDGVLSDFLYMCPIHTVGWSDHVGTSMVSRRAGLFINSKQLGCIKRDIDTESSYRQVRWFDQGQLPAICNHASWVLVLRLVIDQDSDPRS